MSQLPAHDFRAAIAELGRDIVPSMIEGSIGLTAPAIDPDLFNGVEIATDLRYGEHERHVLDVYTPRGGGTSRPVLVYVHGGGFVQGAKSNPTTPFFRNLGAWAVQQGWIAVIINYRLAPEHRHPAGAEDIAAAITWTIDHAAEYGGDAARIVLCGQSAGSVHVADYVVGHGGTGPHGLGLVGAALISPILDVERAGSQGRYVDYWGDDPTAWAARSTLSGLVETDLPLLVTVSEFDEPEFERQAAQFVAAWADRRGGFPPVYQLFGHNHLTPIYAIGTPWDALGPLLRDFVAAHSS